MEIEGWVQVPRRPLYGRPRRPGNILFTFVSTNGFLVKSSHRNEFRVQVPGNPPPEYRQVVCRTVWGGDVGCSIHPTPILVVVA